MTKERAWPAKAMYILIAAALAMSLIIMAAPALKVDAATNEVDAEWDKVPTPTMEDWVLAPGSVIIDYAIGDDGEVAYAIVYGYNVDEETGGVWLLKSENGAATWDDLNEAIVDALEEEDDAFVLNNLIRVATDDEDADFVAVALVVDDGAGNYAVHVLVSSDGGSTFWDTDDDGVDAALIDTSPDIARRVLDLAVSPEVDGKRDLAIVGSDGSGNALIFGCTAYDDHSTDWDDATAYDGWDDNAAFSSIAITDVKFSPNWADDNTVLVTTVVLTDSGTYADDLYTVYLQSGVWGKTTQAWNEDADFEPAVDVLDDVYSTVVPGVSLPQFVGEIDARGIAGLTLPSDYLGDDPYARYAWVWVNYDADYDDAAAVDAEGIIIRVNDGEAGPVREDGQIPGNVWITNVDYLGDIDSGKAIAGLLGTGGYADQTNNVTAYSELATDCCEGVMVYRNDGIADMNTCCEPWDMACKRPTGQTGMAVFYASNDPGEEKAYAVALWGLALCDEGAWSVSMDEGDVWNQLSLIDTCIQYFSDVAVSPGSEEVPCNKTLLVSINDCNGECEGCDCCCDSVWLHAEDLHEAPEYSGQWVRTWCGQLEGDHGILRLAPEEEEAETVYLVDRGNDALYWWEDESETWGCWEDGYAKVLDEIVDLAVSDEEDVIYALDADGRVAKNTDYGSTNQWTETADSKVEEGCTIAVWGDDILVGGSDGEVSFAADTDDESDFEDVTFELLDEDGISTDGYVTVAFDSYYDENNTVYAALAQAPDDDNGIYRWIIGDSEEWKDLHAWPEEWQVGIADDYCDDEEVDEIHYTGLVLDNADGNPKTTAATGGVLYASYYGKEDGHWFTGVARHLKPAEDVVCEECRDWDYLIEGLIDEWDVSYGESFTGWPDALKICGCLSSASNSKLFAIDRYGGYDMEEGEEDGNLWMFEDCYAKKAPDLISPADGGTIPSDPCECIPLPFTIRWDRLCDACSYDLQIALDEEFNEVIYDSRYMCEECPPYYDLEPWCTLKPAEGEAPSAYIMELWGEYRFLLCEYTYYWRVRAADAATDQIIHSWWSEHWSFTVAPGPEAGVELIAPENGATDVATSDIPFSWSSVASAEEYDWVLSRNADLSSPIDTQPALNATACTYTGTALAYDTSYYWQVTAMKEGSPISTSDIGAFRTVAETPPPPEVPEPEIPFWVWVVIAIGTVLVIVVIVLIFRTRRV